MKKKRITYGVTGMMEYQAVIKMGRSKMKVLFTDGSATGYGMNPALYTTDNLMVQKAIENSEQYKRGKIHIVSSTDLEEEVAVLSNPKREEAPAPAPTPAPDEAKSEEADKEESEAGDAGIEEAPAPASSAEEITEMEFDNNDDARDFLETKFGYVRSKLRNRADIIAAGESHGVTIKFS